MMTAERAKLNKRNPFPKHSLRGIVWNNLMLNNALIDSLTCEADELRDIVEATVEAQARVTFPPDLI